MNTTAERQLPPSDRTESGDDKKKAPTLYPCDASIRAQLIAIRELPGWSNNKLASKCGVSSSIVSQYLNDAGCTYPGDVAAFERKANDLLKNEARRRSSGVETIECIVTREVRTAFEYIRKTNDIGAVIMESGDGKTRGLEPYVIANPTCVHIHVRTWHRNESSLRKVFFDSAPKGDYDNRTNRLDYACGKLRGSDRLFIFDDAHKLSIRSLRLVMDFHDETLCPIALVGTFGLLDLLEKDPQLHSRVGLNWTTGTARPKELIEHLIRSQIANINGEYAELFTLCEQVAKEPGHFRAVHKQLKLAVEMRETSTKLNSWCVAFRAAHSKMLRGYKLN